MSPDTPERSIIHRNFAELVLEIGIRDERCSVRTHLPPDFPHKFSISNDRDVWNCSRSIGSMRSRSRQSILSLPLIIILAWLASPAQNVVCLEPIGPTFEAR